MSDAPNPTQRPVVSDAARAVLLRARGLAPAHRDGSLDSLHVLAALAEAPAIGDLLARFEVVPQQVEIRIGAKRLAGSPREDAIEERTVEDGRRVAGELRDPEVLPIHLLVALAGREGSAASEVLDSFGIEGDDLVHSIRFARGELEGWGWTGFMALVPGTDEALADIEGDEEGPDLSPLRRVIGVARAVTASGVTVELIDLEIREATLSVNWRAATTSNARLGMPDVWIHDSAGQFYKTLEVSGRGSHGAWRGSFVAEPAPPDEGILTVEVTSFSQIDWAADLPEEAERRCVAGPWRFTIDLGA